MQAALLPIPPNTAGLNAFNVLYMGTTIVVNGWWSIAVREGAIAGIYFDG